MADWSIFNFWQHPPCITFDTQFYSFFFKRSLILWLILMLHSHNQLYTYTWGNIVKTIMTNEHPSFEKYTSNTLFEMVAKELRKGYVCEVSWRLNKLHIDPQFLCPHQHPISLHQAAQSLGVALATASYLQPTYSKLTELPVVPGYIIIWHPPASCESRICTQLNPSTVKVIPSYLRPDAPVPWLTAGSKVSMLQ